MGRRRFLLTSLAVPSLPRSPPRRSGRWRCIGSAFQAPEPAPAGDLRSRRGWIGRQTG